MFAYVNAQCWCIHLALSGTNYASSEAVMDWTCIFVLFMLMCYVYVFKIASSLCLRCQFFLSLDSFPWAINGGWLKLVPPCFVGGARCISNLDWCWLLSAMSYNWDGCKYGRVLLRCCLPCWLTQIFDGWKLCWQTWLLTECRTQQRYGVIVSYGS